MHLVQLPLVLLGSDTGPERMFIRTRERIRTRDLVNDNSELVDAQEEIFKANVQRLVPHSLLTARGASHCPSLRDSACTSDAADPRHTSDASNGGE